MLGYTSIPVLEGAPVSVWSELRRLKNRDLADRVSPVFGELHRAAHAGDWQGYITLQGGPFVSRSKLVLRVWYQYKNEPSSYGEYQKAIKGLVMPASSIPTVETRLHSYRIVKMKHKSSDRADPGFDFKGASAPSWTRVNNCAEVKKYSNLGGNNLPIEEPEQYEIGQMNQEQKKRFNESIINYKPPRQRSYADEFESLAYAITTSDCDDIEQARVESYLKVAQELRYQERDITNVIVLAHVPAERIVALDDFARSIGMQLNTSLLQHLARGKHLRIGGYIVSATSNGEIRRRKDNCIHRKTADLWKRMKLRHNIDSEKNRHDPFGFYAEMLKKTDPAS